MDVEECVYRSAVLARAINRLVWCLEDGETPSVRAIARESTRSVDRALLLVLKLLVSLGAETVIDVGCGSGLVALALNCGSHSYTICIERDAAMASVARRWCSDVVVGVGELLPLRSSCRAVCVAIDSLHEMGSSVARELARCCRALLALDTFIHVPVPKALRDALSRSLPRLTRFAIEVPQTLSYVAKVLERSGLSTSLATLRIGVLTRRVALVAYRRLGT